MIIYRVNLVNLKKNKIAVAVTLITGSLLLIISLKVLFFNEVYKYKVYKVSKRL